MQCTSCGKELPPGASNCPYCGLRTSAESMPPSAFPANINSQPSAPPQQAFCVKCGATLSAHDTVCSRCGYTRVYTNAPSQQSAAVPTVQGRLTCPRCGSANVTKGGIAQWALIAAIVGFFIVCVLSLLLLLVKEPNRCLNCGFEFK